MQNINQQEKRVKILYRVSTLKQLRDKDENDIPMQEEACRSFVKQQQNWTILDERYEKGVSGYKISAKNRDEVQRLLREARNGEFDVLLVFMFDRIGRIESETPFLVEEFIGLGVEVWSTKEGQQRLDTHTDKLTNYITYWQASGESLKTSIRTSQAIQQMTKVGLFTGGTPAYGYTLVQNGRTNKHGDPVNDLAINEDEAAVVRKMFDYYINQGYGTHTVGTVLAAEGILTRKGKCFTAKSIQYILKNINYIGILRAGDVLSDVMENIVIIEKKTFDSAQKILKSRTKSSGYIDTYTATTVGKTLLSGNIFCGTCGGRLIATSAAGRTRVEDGKPVRTKTPRYVCYNRSRHKHLCDGQTTMSAITIDSHVKAELVKLFIGLKSIPKEDFCRYYNNETTNTAELTVKSLAKKIADKEKERQELQDEVLKSIRGESKFDSGLIQELITGTEQELNKLKEQKKVYDETALNNQSKNKEMEELYNQFLGWGQVFNSSKIETAKIIASHLIDRVTVKAKNRVYSIDLHFKYDFSECYQITRTKKDCERNHNPLSGQTLVYA